MKEYDINKNLFDNIEISDELKGSLITDVKNGKRSADKRFRYSSALMAVCIAGTLIISGGSASAAYLNYKDRLKNMSQQEQADYNEELEADTYNALEEAMTRSLTKAENKKIVELQDEYYKNGVFPKESMPHLDKLSELKPDMLAYVAEDNKIHLPENELSDEQVLQYIDYLAKYTYTIEQNAENEIAENNATDVTSFDVSSADEETLKQKSKEMIKQYFGEEVDDSWECSVFGNKFSELDGVDEAWDSYSISWCESEAPNSKMYQIIFPLKEDGVFIISKSGLEFFVDAEAYSEEDAQQYLAQGEERVKKYVKDNFGLGEPDRIEYGGFEDGMGDAIDSEWITYNLYYGDEYVAVDWVISTDDILGIAGKNLLNTK